MLRYPTRSNLSVLKQQARELLSGIPGIRGIGVGWDSAGNEVLNVDLDPRADAAAVERLLNPLDTTVHVRKVWGTIQAGAFGCNQTH